MERCCGAAFITILSIQNIRAITPRMVIPMPHHCQGNPKPMVTRKTGRKSNSGVLGQFLSRASVTSMVKMTDWQ